VDIFGLKQKGTRISLALEDKPGSMLGVLEVIKKHNIDIISVVTGSFLVEGKRIAALRIRTEDYKDAAADLEKAGYDVLSIGKWPSI
jgi:hypothetical protein